MYGVGTLVSISNGSSVLFGLWVQSMVFKTHRSVFYLFKRHF